MEVPFQRVHCSVPACANLRRLHRVRFGNGSERLFVTDRMRPAAGEELEVASEFDEAIQRRMYSST